MGTIDNSYKLSNNGQMLKYGTERNKEAVLKYLWTLTNVRLPKNHISYSWTVTNTIIKLIMGVY